MKDKKVEICGHITDGWCLKCVTKLNKKYDKKSKELDNIKIQISEIFYNTEEKAFAPGIVKVWPEVIPHPKDKNGRLTKMSLKETVNQS